MLGKLQELLELVLGWGMKALMGVILGYGAIQSLVLPLADSLKTGAVTRILRCDSGNRKQCRCGSRTGGRNRRT